VDQKRIDDLRTRISDDPDNVLDRFVLLKTYLEGGVWNEAVSQAREILSRQPDYLVVHVYLGEALLRSGKKEEARGVLCHAQEMAIRFGHRAPKEMVERLLAELDS
jgi:predicted Zn-dependent protease